MTIQEDLYECTHILSPETNPTSFVVRGVVWPPVCASWTCCKLGPIPLTYLDSNIHHCPPYYIAGSFCGGIRGLLLSHISPLSLRLAILTNHGVAILSHWTVYQHWDQCSISCWYPSEANNIICASSKTYLGSLCGLLLLLIWFWPHLLHMQVTTDRTAYSFTAAVFSPLIRHTPNYVASPLLITWWITWYPCAMACSNHMTTLQHTLFSKCSTTIDCTLAWARVLWLRTCSVLKWLQEGDEKDQVCIQYGREKVWSLFF